MKPPLTPEQYRAGYLKMKTVLHDRATGLPAFPILFDRLRTLLDQRRQLGLLHVEIADLDLVESLYGWQVFDGIVARVASLLREAVGDELPEDALLSLNGVAGDRFVIFVPQQPDGREVDAAFLAGLRQEVCRKLDRAFDADEFAGLSPGICFRAGQAFVSENPFYRFERCVYAAVEEAREFHDRQSRRRELSWGEQLQKIIRNGAVHTVFQPVIEIATREVLGHEALTRGPRDTLFEAPRTMFELSARAGVAGELDRLCCESALDASFELADCGKLFVNVLPESLGEAWFRSDLSELMNRRGLKPADLVIEVSERACAADPGPFTAQLEQIRDTGFGLSLDDVGTGRTGRKAIEQIRPDFLKLDGSLVRNIDGSLVQQEVLRTLTELAAKIGAETIAEGVETGAEAEALDRGGTRYAQGHWFAMPAAAGRPRGGPALHDAAG